MNGIPCRGNIFWSNNFFFVCTGKKKCKDVKVETYFLMFVLWASRISVRLSHAERDTIKAFCPPGDN